MDELFNLFLLDEELLLEAETDDTDVEDIDDTDVDENLEDSEETEKNSTEDSKQNNKEEESEPTSEVDISDNEVDNTDETSGEDKNDISGTEEVEEVDNSRRLFLYDSFDTLQNVTLNFINRIDSIKEIITDDNKKSSLIELERKLVKQKNDINFLLKKKITSMSEENLDKLLLYFTTKTETLVDVTKSLIKEVN